MPSEMTPNLKSGIISHLILPLRSKQWRPEAILLLVTQVCTLLSNHAFYEELLHFELIIITITGNVLSFKIHFVDMIRKGLEGWASLPSDATSYSKVWGMLSTKYEFTKCDQAFDT